MRQSYRWRPGTFSDSKPVQRTFAAFVSAVRALGDGSLQPHRDGGVIQRDTVFLRVNQLHMRLWMHAPGKVTAPLFIRQTADIDTGNVQDVEGEEDCRQALSSVGNLPFQLQLCSVLQSVERRFAVLEYNNFAVKDQRLQWLRNQLGCNFWKCFREIETAPGSQRYLPIQHESQYAITV